MATYDFDDDEDIAALAADMNDVGLEDDQEDLQPTQSFSTPNKFQSPSNIPMPRRRASSRALGTPTSGNVGPTAAERLAASKDRTAALRTSLIFL